MSKQETLNRLTVRLECETVRLVGEKFTGETSCYRRYFIDSYSYVGRSTTVTVAFTASEFPPHPHSFSPVPRADGNV